MSDNGGTEGARRGMAVVWLLAAVTAAALAVRLLAANNPLWVDEIFSLYFVQALRSPLQVFTQLHSDNNHYLNSLWMYALGPQQGAWMYRLPAVICGVLTVPAAYWSGARRGGGGTAAALVWAAMIAISEPLIVYSSEARGYAGAVLAAVAAFGATGRWVEGRDWRWGLAAGLIGVMGLLSQLTYAFVWVALLVWTLAAVRREGARGGLRGGGQGRGWGELALMHGPVVACGLILYEVNVRSMVLLGGPKVGPLSVVEHLIRVMAGWPGGSAAAADVMLLGVLVLVGAGVDWLRRRRQSVWIFYVVLVALPAGLLWFDPPTYLFPRYFLVLAPFVYQLGALLAVRGFQAARWRVAAAGLMAAFVVGQAVLVANFLRVGRGDPAAGVAYLAAHTSTAEIPIVSSRPQRLTIELWYDQRMLPEGRSFEVVSDAAHGEAPWLLLEDVAVSEAPGTLNVQGSRWRKAAAWDSSDLSGQTWIVYRRARAGVGSGAASSRGGE
ncbi:MAG TPA: glycosyltransferase family 39 protein [Phycisphaerae bacterium]|nr:glycosyltransferase family 39 protein [Phycisphaerae bacterium]